MTFWGVWNDCCPLWRVGWHFVLQYQANMGIYGVSDIQKKQNLYRKKKKVHLYFL
jgi:hypothetical protein